MTCTIKRLRTKITATCKVRYVSASSSRVRSIAVRLTRGGRVYASGAARVHGARATVRMSASPRVRSGRRYTLTVVARTAKTPAVTSTAGVTLR